MIRYGQYLSIKITAPTLTVRAALTGLPPRASYWKAAHAKTHAQRKHELCTQITIRRSESLLPPVCLHTVTTVRCW